MLRAISQDNGSTILSIDADEYNLASLPPALLTDEELALVRVTVPDALPGYQTLQPEAQSE